MSPILFNDLEIVKNESIHSSRAAAHCDIKIQRMNKRVGQLSGSNYLQFSTNKYKINIAVLFNFQKTTARELGIIIYYAIIQIVYIALI